MSSVLQDPSAPSMVADPQVQPPTPTPQAAPQSADVQPPQQKSVWKSVLAGALSGLLRGGVFGAIEGATNPRQEEQNRNLRQQTKVNAVNEQTARIHFVNAEAANQASDAALRDAQLHNLPQQIQDSHNAASANLMKDMQTLGLTPTLTVDNTHDGAQAGLQQLTASHGAVPELFTVHIGDKIAAYDLNQLSQSPAILTLVNQFADVTGQPKMQPA